MSSARTATSRENLRRGREVFLNKFRDEARSEGLNDPDEVDERARQLRREHMRRVSYLGGQGRKAKATREAKERQDALLREHIERLVNSAPELNQDQISLLRALLLPVNAGVEGKS